MGGREAEREGGGMTERGREWEREGGGRGWDRENNGGMDGKKVRNEEPH